MEAQLSIKVGCTTPYVTQPALVSLARQPPPVVGDPQRDHAVGRLHLHHGGIGLGMPSDVRQGLP